MGDLAAWQSAVAWVVFPSVYLILALGLVPWIRLDRTGAVFVGAVIVVATGILTPALSLQAQDVETLTLLFSMMIVISFLINSGILGRIQPGVESMVRSPAGLLWVVIFGSGLMSALFINDIVCLALTPIVLDVTRKRGLHPLPFLLATAMASNIGSVMTPVGNPQNIFLASTMHIPYARFVLSLFPVSLAGLLILGFSLLFFYRKKGFGGMEMPGEEKEIVLPPIRTYVLVRTAVVLVLIFAAFWAGVSMAVASASGAAFLLLTRRVSRKRIFALIDWDLLVLFVGLFVLLAAADRAGITQTIVEFFFHSGTGHGLQLSLITALLSNLVSNVPAVLFLSRFLPHLSDPQQAALTMAMVSTLAGNLTLIGSIANLIVAERARDRIHVGFWDYARVGIPVTLLTLIVGLAYAAVVL
ncbi:MAG TPA: SLC13 family permease [Thermoanaerobaculia bacterium]|nr:SLC13 family permease [Thermoanaerobaculia bacterium]HUM29592.1 SLC13 family permease [Thermoanaerobaculia bacterium]HXK67243.1 SLC13 family permease [Thermoanaerobaculia bacterium]